MVSATLVAVFLSGYLNAAGDYAALYQGRIEPQFVYSAWVTHPYWEDDQFHEGSMSYDGKLYPQVMIRYNVFGNIISVLSPNGKIPVAPDMSRIDFFTIENYRYEPQDGWFVRVDYDGKAISMLRSRRKERSGDVLQNNYYLHDMRIIDKFVVRMTDGSVHEVSSLKDFQTLFPDQRLQLKQFAKQNKLSFSRRNRETSLYACAAFVDQQLSDKGMTYTTQPVPASETQTAAVATVVLPDTLLSEQAPLKRVPAYFVYSGASVTGIEYADDMESGGTPGIDNMEVARESRTLDEVEVVGFSQKVTQAQSGMESFRPSLLKNVPLAMGEADVLKLATMLPGVSTTGEASSGINVRGGASEQNLLLYNGNTVFNPMHMFGIVSAFNPDLIAETELFKGGIPSQYGGRLSSVLNIKGRAADKEHFHGSASIGMITAKGVFDIPIVKDKVSLLLGGRSTYSDWMLKMIPEKSGYKDGSAGFWDLGGNLHAMLNRSHTLTINGYYSKDRFAFNDYQKYGYTNMNISSEWKGRYSNGMQSTLTAAYDHYDYFNDDNEYPTKAASLTFTLDQYSLKGSVVWKLTDEHSLMGGLQGVLYQIMPGSYKPIGQESAITGRSLPDDKAVESAAFLEDTWQLSDVLKINGGIRLNLFSAQKEGKEHSYISPDFRLSGSWNIDENQSVKAGFNTLHQYIHKVSNTVIMSPTDNWLLSNSEVKPQQGWQISGGYYWRSDDMVYEFSAETYFKGMDNYLTYRSAAQLVMNAQLEKDVVGVGGRAYGIELQLRKLSGRFNGWISYTFARTQLRQKKQGENTAINNGAWFSADYDVPHAVKFAGNFKFTRRYSMSLNADYSTGRPFTGPIAQFYNQSQNLLMPVYSDRNANRMPDYFRVDWSFNIEPSHHLTARTHRWLTLGVYNLLGRKNAYSVYYQSEGYRIQGYKLSIFGAPIPYITYNIKF